MCVCVSPTHLTHEQRQRDVPPPVHPEPPADTGLFATQRHELWVHLGGHPSGSFWILLYPSRITHNLYHNNPRHTPPWNINPVFTKYSRNKQEDMLLKSNEKCNENPTSLNEWWEEEKTRCKKKKHLPGVNSAQCVGAGGWQFVKVDQSMLDVRPSPHRGSQFSTKWTNLLEAKNEEWACYSYPLLNRLFPSC